MKIFKSLSLLPVAVAVLGGCSGAGNADTVPEEATVETASLRGVISTVPDWQSGEIGGEYDSPLTEGMGCVASPGFDDIVAGGQVLVTLDSGDILAKGSLSEGVLRFTEEIAKPENISPLAVKELPYLFACDFSFEVSNIPIGNDFYIVEIGNDNRGETVLSEEELSEVLELELR